MLQRLGPYILEEKLGAGAMGSVFRARHQELDAPVALKVVSADLSDDPESAARFQRECELLAQVADHPHVVGIHTAGFDAGRLYCVMDLVEGEDLDRRLQRDGPFAPERAAEIVRDVARAVASLHEKGIIHRDLKPSNILLDAEGQPRLVDFGLSKPFLNSQHRLTRTGDLLGTPLYMAPEQAHGRPLSPATDAYALGMLLFTLIAGEAAIPRDGAIVAVLSRIVSGGHRRLEQVVPGAPRLLSSLCAQCFSLDPLSRPSAASLAEALERFLSGEATDPPSRWGLAALAIVVVLGVIAGALWVFTRDAPRTEPAATQTEPNLEPVPGPSLGALRELVEQAQSEQKQHPVRAALRFAEALAGLNRPGVEAAELRAQAERGVRRALQDTGRGLRARIGSGEYRTCAFGPQGELVTGSNKGVLELWSPAGRLVHRWPRRRDKIRACAISADGELVAFAWAATAEVWSTTTKRRLRSWPAEVRTIRTVAFSPNRQLLASGDDTGQVRIFHVDSSAPARTVGTHVGRVYSVAFSPDSHTLASASNDRTLVVWDLLRSGKIHTLKHRRKVRSGLFTRDGKQLLTCGDDGTIRVFRVEKWTLSGQLSATGSQVKCADLSGDDRIYAAGDDDGRVHVWDLERNARLTVFKGHDGEEIEGIAVSHDGLLVASAGEEGVHVWRVPGRVPSLVGLGTEPLQTVRRALQRLRVDLPKPSK